MIDSKIISSITILEKKMPPHLLFRLVKQQVSSLLCSWLFKKQRHALYFETNISTMVTINYTCVVDSYMVFRLLIFCFWFDLLIQLTISSSSSFLSPHPPSSPSSSITTTTSSSLAVPKINRIQKRALSPEQAHN